MAGWDDLLSQVHELADVAAAAGLLDWDQQTMMRPKSAESRAFQQGTIQAIHHERLTASALRGALERAEREGDGPAPFTDDARKALLREVRRLSEEPVRQCAWCGRCRCGDHWVQLRGAHVKPAVTSHGLCPRCFDALTRQPSIRVLLESARLRAAANVTGPSSKTRASWIVLSGSPDVL